MRNSIIAGLLFLMILMAACAQKQASTKEPTEKVEPSDVSSLNPKQVVILYFQAWNDKQYNIMYSLISDGFKQIEPTAKSFDDFKNYMSKFYETSTGVEIVEVIGGYQNDKEAGVNYKIRVVGKNGKKADFGSTYTLKKRANGWKLIHPYGNNIDTT